MNDRRPSIEDLKSLARAASKNAYSPYSRLRVGAVVVDGQGNTYTGCNVESASYGLTQCAERNALGAAITAGVAPGSIQTLLVYANGFKALSPCGACRQVMSELMEKDARVVSCSGEEVEQAWTMSQLYPDPFILE